MIRLQGYLIFRICNLITVLFIFKQLFFPKRKQIQYSKRGVMIHFGKTEVAFIN